MMFQKSREGQAKHLKEKKYKPLNITFFNSVVFEW